MANIQNIRLGFANNSSSSHSIVFLKGDLSGVRSNDEEYEFGWDFFTCASKRSKENYLISTVAGGLVDRVGEDTARLVLAQLLGRAPEDMELDGYVDHQSHLLVPREFSGLGIDREFWNDLSEVILRDDVAVLGGNDNTESNHPLAPRSSGAAVGGEITDCHGDWVARKDGDIWSLFDRGTGHKIRFSFGKPGKKVEYNRSSLPELVDVKITDFCPYNCAFCYQGSTVAGKHANSWSVRRLAEKLGEMKVFEVAIGGGEPTLHPEFVEILRSFRKAGVVPNFTTRNLAWLRDEELCQQIKDVAGSFAFSTESEGDISKLITALDYHGFDRRRASVQLVVGATYAHETKRLVQKCLDANLGVTLLGYKETGRGSDFKPKAKPAEVWEGVKDLAKGRWMTRIGIDTVFAAQIEEQLKADKVDPSFYHTRDGVFSCYVDMVTGRMAPSSYCDESEYVALPKEDKGEFGSVYRSFAMQRV